jgi:hypothetical protein
LTKIADTLIEDPYKFVVSYFVNYGLEKGSERHCGEN